MSRTIARKYSFEGQVQGVGFRRITESLARSFPVTGYVMNLADGRVELHVEGPIEDIDHLIEEIGKKFETKITRVSQELVNERKYNQFQITFEKGRAEM